MSLTGTPEEGAALLQGLRYAYRIAEQSEWEASQACGLFKGTQLDEKDGFLHLSLPSEVLTTIGLYFASHPGPLLVLQVDLASIPEAQLRADWVAQRSAFFPHVTGGKHGYHVPVASITRVFTLTRAGSSGEWQGFDAAGL